MHRRTTAQYSGVFSLSECCDKGRVDIFMPSLLLLACLYTGVTSPLQVWLGENGSSSSIALSQLLLALFCTLLIVKALHTQWAKWSMFL